MHDAAQLVSFKNVGESLFNQQVEAAVTTTNNAAAAATATATATAAAKTPEANNAIGATAAIDIDKDIPDQVPMLRQNSATIWPETLHMSMQSVPEGPFNTFKSEPNSDNNSPRSTSPRPTSPRGADNSEEPLIKKPPMQRQGSAEIWAKALNMKQIDTRVSYVNVFNAEH
jgi:hypothetical protein